ncbi:MAG: hypothetical protein RLZZ450_6352 [Pseudomonadota bacterium]
MLLCALWCGPRVQAQAENALPFEEAELGRALAARAPQLTYGQLRLEPLEGRLLISVGPRSRVVDLAGLEGSDAARVVAVLAADLAAQAANPEPWQVDRNLGRSTGAALDRYRVGIDAAAIHGAQSSEGWSFASGLAAAIKLPRRFMLGARSEYWTMPTVHSRTTGTELHFQSLALRTELGLGFAPLLVSIGGVCAPYWVRGGQGHRDVLGGVGVSAAVWLPVRRGLRLGVRVQVDTFLNRTRLLSADETAFVTPRVALGLSLGMAWGWS